jgi:hypothetical protein
MGCDEWVKSNIIEKGKSILFVEDNKIL